MAHDRIPPWSPPRSLLVLHDLTRQAGHAAWRAGMVARDCGAALCLLHAAKNASEADRAGSALARLRDEIAEHLGVHAELRVLQGEALGPLLRNGRGADLVVLGATRTNVLRDWVFGTPAERVIRLCGSPVLVVKRPATSSWRRVLVPVDFGPAALPAIQAATTLSRSTGIEVFHSLATREEVAMRTADVPELEVRRHRQRSMAAARERIDELILGVPGASFSALPSVGLGHPSGMVLEKEFAMRADLVVIGKRRRGLLADFFLGSVTQRVLAAGRADVLVLPAARQKVASRLPTDPRPPTSPIGTARPA